MRIIRDCFEGPLEKIYQQASQLESITALIQKALPMPLSQHCKAAGFHKGILIIATDNAAWATELRYQSTTLCGELRRAGLYQLVAIKQILDINPRQAFKEPKIERKPLSINAQQALLAASEACQYEPLQKALRRLAEVNQEETSSSL